MKVVIGCSSQLITDVRCVEKIHWHLKLNADSLEFMPQIRNHVELNDSLSLDRSPSKALQGWVLLTQLEPTSLQSSSGKSSSWIDDNELASLEGIFWGETRSVATPKH